MDNENMKCIRAPQYVKSSANDTSAKPTEETLRKSRCCFTGHRPQKLYRPIDDIKVDLENEILASINAGYSTFITGMAYGIDIWAGNIVIRLKDRFPQLRLIAAVPYDSFSDNWEDDWKRKYNQLLSQADLIKTLSPEFSDTVFQQRNQWMVDHSSKVIAVYDGQPGGTRNTIRYAREHGVAIRYVKG